MTLQLAAWEIGLFYYMFGNVTILLTFRKWKYYTNCSEMRLLVNILKLKYYTNYIE